jgi:hypothetical protein
MKKKRAIAVADINIVLAVAFTAAFAAAVIVVVINQKKIQGVGGKLWK